MDAFHLLLGHLCELDCKVSHDGYFNTYMFKFNKCSFTLKPSTPQLKSQLTTQILLMKKAQFEAAMWYEGHVILLIPKLTPLITEQHISMSFRQSNKNFKMCFLVISHPAYLYEAISNIKLTLFLTRLFRTVHMIEWVQGRTRNFINK